MGFRHRTQIKQMKDFIASLMKKNFSAMIMENKNFLTGLSGPGCPGLMRRYR